MDISTASLDLGPADYLATKSAHRGLEGAGAPAGPRPMGPPEQERLRHIAWEIGERRCGDQYVPPSSHVGLTMVHPTLGFAHWNLLPSWVDEVARSRGDRWDRSRPIMRLYDVSCIHFTGLNAHRIQDEHLPGLAGQLFFHLPNPGTWQLAEVGFLLADGEFIPATRSPVVCFAQDSPSRHSGHAAMLVHGPGRLEEIPNVWNQDHELRERRRPRLRHPLRIAALAFASHVSGQEGSLADFVTELARGQRSHGHDVHVFVPGSQALPHDREVDGVQYHAIHGVEGGCPIEVGRAFALAVEKRLAEMPPFDLLHLHEWMTALGNWDGQRPTVLSLGSLEATRRGDQPADAKSRDIEALEKRLASQFACVLTPAWLRERAISELGINPGQVHAFGMEGRMPNEWEAPLDVGHVKMGIGVGPLDRLLLFVGPLEHAAGVDILLESVPVLLRRWGNLRLGFVGCGPMHDHLHRRAGELGIHWAVRFLGDRGGRDLVQLLRASEALVLPSRYRIALDDAVIDLARKASRPVVTTHGGPGHLVRHEENGLITYDNPGSMVWAVDRILSDPGHAERMGQNGRRSEGGTLRWTEVAHHYLEGCVAWFPELTVTRM